MVLLTVFRLLGADAPSGAGDLGLLDMAAVVRRARSPDETFPSRRWVSTEQAERRKTADNDVTVTAMHKPQTWRRLYTADNGGVTRI